MLSESQAHPVTNMASISDRVTIIYREVGHSLTQLGVSAPFHIRNVVVSNSHGNPLLSLSPISSTMAEAAANSSDLNAGFLRRAHRFLFYAGALYATMVILFTIPFFRVQSKFVPYTAFSPAHSCEH